MMPSFRRTTRDYHEEKEHFKLLHGAPLGRYNPSYHHVTPKIREVEIKGVKDRFGYNNKNSPHYIKPAVGQHSAMTTMTGQNSFGVRKGSLESFQTVGGGLAEIKSRNRD